MQFTDTHTHLFSEQFDDDIDAVMQRAFDSGVCKMYLPNINSETIDSMMELSKKYPDNCFPLMGLHPCDVKEDYQKEIDLVVKWHGKHKFLAVGEIGIDLFWDKAFVEQQKDAFLQQIQLAKRIKLPIVIHVRDSFDEVFEIVDRENDESLFGIFHCFTGSLEQAEHILNYGGFKLGLGGVLTFKNSGLDRTIAEVNMEHLVLETDSPYLAPMPHRGKRNESAYLRLVAEKLAEIKNLPLSEVARITTENANQVFHGK
ncbi:MAG: TatD family hydrolase [Flavobacteriales bacterium]|nr:TatD family hydrolase [Flavobacteriales bacterium]